MNLDSVRLKPLRKIPKNIRLAITRLKLDKEAGRPLENHLVDRSPHHRQLSRIVSKCTTHFAVLVIDHEFIERAVGVPTYGDAAVQKMLFALVTLADVSAACLIRRD